MTIEQELNIQDTVGRHTLSLVFGLMVMLSLVLGGVALREIGRLQDNLDAIVRDNNIKIRLSNTMSDAVHTVSRVIPKLALLHEPAEVEAAAHYNAAAPDPGPDRHGPGRGFPALPRCRHGRSAEQIHPRRTGRAAEAGRAGALSDGLSAGSGVACARWE